jgi:hypothetical protein
MAIKLSDLNTRKKCEEALDFEPLTKSGKGMGITLKVLGGHAESVQKWVTKELNNRKIAEEMQKRRGKSAAIRPVEEDIEFGDELIAIRIVGWEGIADTWSPENALILVQTNPDIKAQVQEFSEDTENFTKG